MAKDKVVAGEFGGEGPRQILGDLMKNADSYKSILAVTINEDGDVELWANAMEVSDLAILSMRAHGYGMLVVNGWDEDGQEG